MAPNSVRQIATAAKYELLKYLRGRRLLAIVLLTIIVSAIFLIVPPAIGSHYPKDATQFTLNMFGFLGILSILSATFLPLTRSFPSTNQKPGTSCFQTRSGRQRSFSASSSQARSCL
jgi:ABC-type transport system involved in multi-copper enzyme maturation permease subunit